METPARAALLDALIERAPAGILVEDAGGLVVGMNQALCDLFGTDTAPEAWRGASAGHVFGSLSAAFDDPPGFLHGVSYLHLNGTRVDEEPLRLRTGVLLRRSYGPVFDAGQRVGTVWTFQRDAADAAGDARRTRAYFERLLEALPAQLAVLSPSGRYEYVTSRAIDDPAVREWVVGKTDVELGLRAGLPPGVVEERRERILRAVTTGEVSEFEESLPGDDGELRHVRRFVAPVRDADGVVRNVLGYGQDITAQRHAEERLLQVQRLDAVGRLAGGLAHDFNNLLTVILGFTGAARDRLPGDHEVVPDLNVALQAATHAADLVRQLNTFSRNDVVPRTTFDLDEVVRQAASSAQRQLAQDVAISVDASGAKYVRGDPGQMRKVVSNLIFNSLDAMPRGGSLRVSTRVVELEVARAARLGTAPGSCVELAVTDTGVGMSEAVRRRIFEPFFTTKAAGQGTGLGMSIVYGIVVDAGGHIEVESRPGTGTTVRVLLPMLREQPPVHAVPASSAQLMPRGSETVLVVDDDARVRTMTANVLADLGYRTLSAPSGSAALELAARHDGPIHLAIVDVAMPKMTGTELAERLAAARPLTKVLFASGYADSPAVRDAVQAQRAVFLTKPYTVPDLARRVRRLLDAPD